MNSRVVDIWRITSSIIIIIIIMTEKAFLPSDDRTYGMERTSESEDRVETECDGNERLL